MNQNKKKIIYSIINPISGTGKQKVVEYLIEKFLDFSKFEITIKYTEKPKHAIEISKQSVTEYDIIVAVGGDGSVNEVAKALINSNAILGIIPTGSGNGLSRHLKIPMNLKKAVSNLNNLNIQEIDTATINGYHFLGTAGIGFDAHIGWKFSTAKKKRFLDILKNNLKRVF